MSNTKKIIAVALSLLLITAFFTACSKKSENKPTDTTNTKTSDTPVIDVNAPSSPEDTGTTAPEGTTPDSTQNSPTKKPENSGTASAKPTGTASAPSSTSTTSGKVPSTKPTTTSTTAAKPTSSAPFEIGSSSNDDNGYHWFG